MSFKLMKIAPKQRLATHCNFANQQLPFAVGSYSMLTGHGDSVKTLTRPKHGPDQHRFNHKLIHQKWNQPRFVPFWIEDTQTTRIHNSISLAQAMHITIWHARMTNSIENAKRTTFFAHATTCHHSDQAEPEPGLMAAFGLLFTMQPKEDADRLGAVTGAALSSW